MAALVLPDITGRQLRTLPPAATSLSLATEPAGVYLVAVTPSDRRVRRRRIIKQ